MKTIAIGGSRMVFQLTQSVKSLLDDIINNNDFVIIGDANGADKAVQKYLFAAHCKRVTVYCMRGECRNNIGGWQTKDIVSNRNKKDASYYGEKDLQMSRDADSGIMLWDGESKGTFRNIINLLVQNKGIDVYYQPQKLLARILSYQDFYSLIQNADSKNGLVFKKEVLNYIRSTDTHELAPEQGSLFAQPSMRA